MSANKICRVAWVPCNPELSENRLFDIRSARDNAIERFVESFKILNDNGYDCQTIDMYDLKKVDVIIFYGISSDLMWLGRAIKSNSNVRLINIPIEPPVISPLHEKTILSSMPFDRVMVWSDELALQGVPFVKANIGEAMISRELIPAVPFNKKKFIVAITSSKLISHENGIHQERFHAFEFFSVKEEGIDLYGMGWDKVSYPFVKSSYRGICDTKKEVLQNYKFSICFENAKNYSGLITEKIFDCFSAGTVPIYYGSPNVTSYIPERCFIDFAQFSSYEDLYQFLNNMTEDEYQNYLDAVKEFVETPEYYQFTSKRFSEIVLEQVKNVMNEPSPNRSLLGFKLQLLKIVLCHPLIFIKNIKQCRRFLFDLFFKYR